jgi:hypothetical protein
MRIVGSMKTRLPIVAAAIAPWICPSVARGQPDSIEAARAVGEAEVALDSARHSIAAVAGPMELAARTYAVAAARLRLGDYDGAREFAHVAVIEARSAKQGPAHNHFDREPAGAGAPPLRDSIPFGVTPVDAHP